MRFPASILKRAGVEVIGEVPAERAPSKYSNKIEQMDGITFDSRAEAWRYNELKLLEESGQITDLVLQPVFVLQEAFVTPDGQQILPITYVADFAYNEGHVRVVEDIKGMATEIFRVKRKMFLFHYPDLDLRVLNPKTGQDMYKKEPTLRSFKMRKQAA